MTVPAPPSMTSAPSPAPTREDPVNFRPRADAYHSWLVPWVNTQLPAVLDWIRARANEVYSWSVNTQAASVNVTALVNTAAVQNAAANAATAQAAATAAAQYASQAQATNPDSPIRINPTRVMANFALATGYNGASAGPISIGDGVTVTISNGATWSIH
jgi:hypothetical protein